MPVYTYKCDNCGVQFDKFQKFSDKPLTRCPECSKKAVRRMLQPPAIVFKGSGWYATDHRSPSGQGSNGKKSEGEPAKAESKPEKKKAAKASKSDE